MCGGAGTRLRPLTFERPKPSIPLLNKPSVGHLVDHLSANGFNDIVITLGYLGRNIEEYLEDGAKFGVEIHYIRERKKLGTAGSVKNAENALGGGPFLVVGGDHVMDFNLHEFYQFHRKNDSMLTVGVMSIDDPREYGILDIDVNNRVHRFREKPSSGEIFSNLASTGIYMCDPELFSYIPKERFDFAKDLFPKLLSSHDPMSAWMARGHWNDIGNATAYRQASRWLLDNLRGTEIAGRFNIKDARLNGPATIGTDVSVGSNSAIVGPVVIGANTTVGDNVLISPYTTIGSDCDIADDTSVLSGIVYDNVKIGSRTSVSGSVVDNGTRIGDHCVLENNTVIGPRVTINDFVTVHSGVSIWPDVVIDGGDVYKDALNPAYDTHKDGS
jgi:Nucleoside-diphosphate-sugar pyrophosphorylase involved in lipopolysaccharide biosynthesis/translation initiation factor 2B, gamma/epsilon subunits (eIF-2Bgamma/eIF-2Bepsilon)